MLNNFELLSINTPLIAFGSMLLGGVFYIQIKKSKRLKILKDFENIKIPLKNIEKKKYGFLVKAQNGIILEDFNEQIKRISEILDLKITEIERVKKGVFKLIRTDLPKETGRLKGNEEQIPIGVDKYKNVLYWNIFLENLIALAPTRSGKSVFALAVMLEFHKVFKQSLKIVIIDYKRGADFSSLKLISGLDVEIYNPTTQLDEILELFEYYEQKIGEANELRAIFGANNDNELGDKLPYKRTLLFMDEVERYLNPLGCDKETGEKRKKLIKLFNDANGAWASSCLFMFSATQSPKVGDLKFQLTNITAKYLGYTSQESLNYLGIDKRFANQRDYKYGKALYVSSMYPATEIRSVYAGTNKDLMRKLSK